MTVFETIQRRRSIGKMTEQSPTRQQIEQILEAATHAPNHHKAEPWKFFVLTGKARSELGSLMATSLEQRLQDSQIPVETHAALLEKERLKPLRSPVVIVVAAEHPTQPKVIEIENVEATAAAIQNMLLTATEAGLAAVWRTGEAAYDPTIKKWLGLATEDHIVGFVYLGYPAIAQSERQPQPIASKTTWLGWQD